jgi:hypothetical protein
MRTLFCFSVLAAASLSAQTLVQITDTNYRDAAGHKLSGTCSANPQGVSAPPWFVAPVPTPFTVSNGSYSLALLPGNYTATCSINYGKQSVTISMNWVVPSGGPYRIEQVAVTSPSGQQYTVLAQQLAAGGSDGQVLVKDSTSPTGQRWATISTGGGGSLTWSALTSTQWGSLTSTQWSSLQ